MTIIQSLLFGILEGLTEFIPVSSTAHMLLAQHFLAIPASDSIFAFIVLIQLGPLAALIVYFHLDLWLIVKAFFSKPFSTLQNRMAWYIIIGSIPALLAGVIFKDIVERLFQNPLMEAVIRLVSAAILLLLAEWFGQRTRVLNAMTPIDSFLVGIFQALAVFPGASRSGAAISGGMLRNFDRPAATRFAFLLSVPVMLAAGAYESFSVFRQGSLGTIMPATAVGTVVAGIVGWLSIRWLIDFVSNHTLRIFAVYCLTVGLVCALCIWI